MGEVFGRLTGCLTSGSLCRCLPHCSATMSGRRSIVFHDHVCTRRSEAMDDCRGTAVSQTIVHKRLSADDFARRPWTRRFHRCMTVAFHKGNRSSSHVFHPPFHHDMHTGACLYFWHLPTRESSPVFSVLPLACFPLRHACLVPAPPPRHA